MQAQQIYFRERREKREADGEREENGACIIRLVYASCPSIEDTYKSIQTPIFVEMPPKFPRKFGGIY